MISPFINSRQVVAEPISSESAISTPVSESDYAVQVVNGDDLPSHRAAWERLVDDALEPNCFYEPWMLLPAVEHFGQQFDLAFALIYHNLAADSPRLCGLVPLERRTRWRGLPVRSLALWKHQHSVLCTPLLHRDHARAAMRAFLAWAKTRKAGASVLDFSLVPGEGPFAQVLQDVLQERGCATFGVESYQRALLRIGADAEGYVHGALAPKHRRELQRLRRRLADMGQLETRQIHSDSDLDRWIDQFLTLEARGWKGSEGTALSCSPSERAYFTDIVRQAHARQRLMMLGLFLDDRPIAMKCNFRAGDGAFALKIAFDEDFDKSSPGVQLELDNIAAAHRLPGLAWMDSCAIAKHPMIDRLWTERRTMQHILISTGRWQGDLVVRALPWLRAFKRTLRRSINHATRQC